MGDMQLDIFGGEAEPESPRPRNPYHPKAYDYLTCWEDCIYCSTELYSQRSSDPSSRIFAFCHRIGQTDHRCFEHTHVCEHARLKGAPVEGKPKSAGWEDY